MCAYKIDTNFKVLFFAFALTLSIWLTGHFIPQFNSVQSILGTDQFPGKAADWQAQNSEYFKHNPSSVILFANESARNKLTKKCPEVKVSNNKLKVRVSTNVKIIEEGKISGRNSVVGFWFINSQNKVDSYRNITFHPGRSRETIGFRVIDWPATAVGCKFGLITKAGGPTIELREASIEFVSDNQTYRFLIMALIVCLVLYVLYLIVVASRMLSFRQLLLPVAFIILLICGVMLASPFIAKYFHPPFLWIIESLQPIFWGVDKNRTALSWIFKLGHAVMFSFIAFCFFYLRKKINASRVTVLTMLVVLAAASEGLQLHLADRAASGSDFILDCLGILVGWSICELYQRFVRSS